MRNIINEKIIREVNKYLIFYEMEIINYNEKMEIIERVKENIKELKDLEYLNLDSLIREIIEEYNI
jgi:hypothetical protein